VGPRDSSDQQARRRHRQRGGGVSDDDPYDLKRLRIDPATFAAPPIPAKIRKRRGQFVLMPMWWYERLKNPPVATGITCLVALHLLHLNWKNHGKQFKLPNGMLEYDGISRQSKWRALADLERRGLIAVQRRPSKSPIIHVRLQPV
jgi:hypothetical protein